MKKQLTIILLLLFFVSACSLFQKDSFAGEWNINLTGGVDVNLTVVIGDTYEFSTNRTITYSGRDFDVTVKGKVDKDGKIDAELIANGQAIGDLSGLLNYQNGKGTWNAAVLSGTWNAVKK